LMELSEVRRVRYVRRLGESVYQFA
jgi:hypothetical protein